ncbi:hypothetical protein EG68_10186 [Paragonimus skrjabini miyazakii]|uniref:Uncharacterized protein n=1 Tax=Paragonimus skrjabini miyazakii TaxID=59628 RepID=A0A8S9YKN7_9TREM|nr:hypothetical protein EG68_10186 [Paragonimus skrjabini miyazakii]
MSLRSFVLFSHSPLQQHEPTEEFLNLAKVEPSYAAADLQKSVGSSVYTWSSNTDRNRASSEAIPSVPLPTSTHQTA